MSFSASLVQRFCPRCESVLRLQQYGRRKTCRWRCVNKKCRRWFQVVTTASVANSTKERWPKVEEMEIRDMFLADSDTPDTNTQREVADQAQLPVAETNAVLNTSTSVLSVTERTQNPVKQDQPFITKNSDAKMSSKSRTNLTSKLVEAQRFCRTCDSAVRPQQCGRCGLRWRCSNKNCRIWFEWVVRSDVLPTPLRSRDKPMNLRTALLHEDRSIMRTIKKSNKKQPKKEEETEGKLKQEQPAKNFVGKKSQVLAVDRKIEQLDETDAIYDPGWLMSVENEIVDVVV